MTLLSSTTADRDKEKLMVPILSDVLRSLRGTPIFAFYVLATLTVAVVIALITFNIIDLGMNHFGDEAHRSHDVAYGLLFTTLVVGVLAQLRRPGRNVAAMAMAIMPAAGLLLAGVLTDQVNRVVEFNPFRYAAAVTAVVTLLHPTGRAFCRSFRVSRISWPMLALVGVAAVPMLGLASTNVRLQRTVTDSHTFVGHYGFMAALAYTMIGVGLIASLRPIGWRLSAWATGLLPVLLGGTSLLYPNATSSLITAWAVAALAWGTAFISLAARTKDAASPTASAAGDVASEPQRLVRATPTRR